MSTEYSTMSEKITTITAYIAAGSTVFLSFINTYAAAIGVIVGGITLIMNWWFKWQHLKLAKEKKSKEELEKLNGYIE